MSLSNFQSSENFPVVIQQYDTDVNKEYIIRGNAGILKCQVPSFVGDYLNIVAWHTDHNETFAANDDNYGDFISFIFQFLIPHFTS